MNENPPSYTPDEIAEETPKARQGALELRSIIAARSAGQTPAAADIAALRAMRPATIAEGLPDINIDQTIADLHSGDITREQAAWRRLEGLWPADLPNIKPVSLAELGAPPPREWLIKNWLPLGRVGMLTGEGGRGKSWLALQLAAAITTTGGHWLQRAGASDPKMPPVDGHGTVVFATWEDEPTEFVRRIGTETAAAMQNCHIVDLAGTGPVWGAAPGASTQTRAQLLPTGESLRAFAKQVNADLLILDSLAGAFGSNENDRSLVREFMASWDAWGRDADCTVMLLAHPPKTAATGYSGSTDWHGASRWRWELTQEKTDDNETLEKLVCEKASYTMKPDPIHLMRDRATGWAWREAGKQNSKGMVKSGNNGTGQTQPSGNGDPRRRKVTNAV